MALFNTGNQFPYTNFHDLNLDWIIREVKKALEDWVKLRGEWSAYQVAMDSAWAAYKSATDADLAAYKANLNQEWSDYQVDNNAAFQAFKTALEGRQDKVEGDFADLKQFVLDYFDNVDWAQLLKDLMDTWYANGTLIRLIAPYLPFLTPEMYGAVADGVTDDASALNDMMQAAVTSKKSVWFSPNSTFRCASQVSIPGTVDIHGNGATVEFNDGVNGFVFTQHGPESVIDNITINSAGTRWPDLGIADLSNASMDPEYGATWQDTCTKGLIVGALHSKLTRININNFGIGMYYDERIYDETQNQTGLIINNCHIRYCGVACRLGYKLRNGHTTDYTITDCTFAGRHIGLMITDAIGYFLSNIHTWGGPTEGEMLCGIYSMNTSITTFDRIYIEPCRLYAAYIHTRKGCNIDNFVYVTTFGYRTDQARVFHFDGSRGYKVNLDNIEIRPGTPDYTAGKPYVKPILIHQGMGGIFNIGNVFTSEQLQHTIYNPTTGEDVTVNYASVLPGVAYDLQPADQKYGYFYTNNSVLQLKSNPYVMQINGKLVPCNPIELSIPFVSGVAGSVTYSFDMTQIEYSKPVPINIYTSSRDQTDNMTFGEYAFAVIKRYGTREDDYADRDKISVTPLTTIVQDPEINLSFDVSELNKLKITATQTNPSRNTSIVIEPKYISFALSNTPETNPYV